MAYTVDDFQRDSDVSRETLADYQAWHALLIKWNKRINLVSKPAMADFWQRHALDSWQLWPEIPPNSQTIIDLGSGAGFPAIALAIMCKSEGRGHVTLVESAGKKVNFLKTVIRELGLPATVKQERAETLEAGSFDIVTARAFAPMAELLTYAQPFWKNETIGLFLKGQNLSVELTRANEMWDYHAEALQSRSDSTGQIVKVTGLSSKAE